MWRKLDKFDSLVDLAFLTLMAVISGVIVSAFYLLIAVGISALAYQKIGLVAAIIAGIIGIYIAVYRVWKELIVCFLNKTQSPPIFGASKEADYASLKSSWFID